MSSSFGLGFSYGFFVWCDFTQSDFLEMLWILSHLVVSHDLSFFGNGSIFHCWSRERERETREGKKNGWVKNQ
jgi:hypothetical protein